MLAVSCCRPLPLRVTRSRNLNRIDACVVSQHAIWKRHFPNEISGRSVRRMYISPQYKSCILWLAETLLEWRANASTNVRMGTDLQHGFQICFQGSCIIQARGSS